MVQKTTIVIELMTPHKVNVFSVILLTLISPCRGMEDGDVDS